MKKLLLLLVLVAGAANAQWQIAADNDPYDEYYKRAQVKGVIVKGSSTYSWLNVSHQGDDIDFYVNTSRLLKGEYKMDIIFDNNKKPAFSDIDMLLSVDKKALFMYSSGYYKEIKNKIFKRMKNAAKMYIRIRDGQNRTVFVFYYTMKGSAATINKVINSYERKTGDNSYSITIRDPFTN